MVLDIKDKDNIVRLIYIAVLRVKKLSGLIFKYRFNKEQFQSSTSKTKEARLEDFI